MKTLNVTVNNVDLHVKYSGIKISSDLYISTNYIVEKEFTVTTRYGQVTIPKGFEHDGYTIVPDLSSLIAAIVHDFLYVNRIFNDMSSCSRKMADRIFKDLIKKIPEDYKYANLYHTGVRVFGWIPWYWRTFKLWVKELC